MRKAFVRSKREQRETILKKHLRSPAAFKLTPTMIVLAVFTISVVLRLFGIRWGLPDPSRLHSYHPDEVMILAPVVRMNIFEGDLNPHFFNYGSLFLYIVYFARLILEGIGLLDLSAPNSFAWVNQWAVLHLTARWLSALLGAGTVVMVYIWGHRLWGAKVSLVPAILLASYPLHLQHSHFATVDVPLTFFTTAALYFLVFRQGLCGLILSSFMSGLATATKYSVGPALFLAILSNIPLNPIKSTVVSALLSLIVFFIGFFVGCPYSILAFDEFFRDFYWEAFVHSRQGHGYIFQNTGNGFVYHLVFNLPSAVGLSGCLAAVMGLVAALRKRHRTVEERRTLRITLVFFLAYFIPLAFSQVRFCRYLMPVLPLLALWSGFLFSNEVTRGVGTPGRKAAVSVATVSVVATFLSGWAINGLFAGPDPRDRAADWLKTRLHTDRTGKVPTLALHDAPWFYTPPFSPYNGGSKTASAFRQWARAAALQVVTVGFSVEALRKYQPDFFVTSDYEFYDPLRLGIPEAVVFYEEVQRRSTHMVTFSSVPYLYPFRVPFVWHFKPLPHDMKYVNPQIRVYVFGSHQRTDGQAGDNDSYDS